MKNRNVITLAVYIEEGGWVKANTLLTNYKYIKKN